MMIEEGRELAHLNCFYALHCSFHMVEERGNGKREKLIISHRQILSIHSFTITKDKERKEGQ